VDILRPIVRYITDPLYSRRDGYAYGAHGRELDRTQWLTPPEISEIQNRRLVDLIQFAYSENDVYRKRMNDAGVVPSDIKSKQDLQVLPVLQKSDIRAAGVSLFSKNYDATNTLFTRTGGSTGVPLRVYIDKEAMNWKYAATWRHNQWAGWSQGTKVAAVWGDTDKKRSLREELRFWLQHRMIFLDTLNFTEDKLKKFHSDIRRYKPIVMMGHAHSVYQFAKFCAENSLETPTIGSVVTTAMTLSELERAVIEEALDAKVFNRYGCEELSIIASEAPEHVGLHVFSEGLILEYLPTEIDGEFELLVTDLFNKAMPMIRYAIEDIVRPASGDCPTGRGLERLEKVSGRSADFLYRRDGTPVFGISLLDTYVIHIPGVKQAQIVQNDFDEFEINVVPSDEFSSRTQQALQEIIFVHFGAQSRVLVNKVNELEKTERGKYRFSVCHIDAAEREVRR